MSTIFTTHPVSWVGGINVTVAGTSLKKTRGCDGCRDAGAVSAQQIVSGDGYVEFTATNTTAQYVVSLGKGGGAATLIGDFALHFRPDKWRGIAEVGENGRTYKADIPFIAGDVFRIAVVNHQVQYLKNGLVFYASGTAPVYPLVAMASLWNLGATVNNAIISGALSGAPTTGRVKPPVASVAAQSASIEAIFRTPSCVTVEGGTICYSKSRSLLPTRHRIAHDRWIRLQWVGMIPKTAVFRPR